MSEARTRSGIFNHSISQVLAWFRDEYQAVTGNPLSVFQVSSPSALKDIDPKLNRPDGSTDKLGYPYVLLTIGDISIDTERAGVKKNRAMGGILTGRDLHNKLGYVEDVRPVVVSIGISFRTDSLDDLMDMCNVLLMNHPAVGFSMKTAQGFTVLTRLEIEPNFSTPPADFEMPGTGYIFETVVRLRTYIGTAREVRLIGEIVQGRYDASQNNAPFIEQADQESVEVIKWHDYYNKNKPAYNSLYVNKEDE